MFQWWMEMNGKIGCKCLCTALTMSFASSLGLACLVRESVAMFLGWAGLYREALGRKGRGRWNEERCTSASRLFLDMRCDFRFCW